VYFGGGIMFADFFVWSSYAKSMWDYCHRRSHKRAWRVFDDAESRDGRPVLIIIIC
jgi:hypothetical protein